MHNKVTHPLLAQVPLTVSPFISMPVAVTLPYTYKKLPSTLPPSSTGTPAGQQKIKYIISASGYAAHPDEILASCIALREYLQKALNDADLEVKNWEIEVAARELAEKRKVAPGWLDSDARLLEPERPRHEGTLTDFSSVAGLGVVPSKEGDELDRAFGDLGLDG